MMCIGLSNLNIANTIADQIRKMSNYLTAATSDRDLGMMISIDL